MAEEAPELESARPPDRHCLLVDRGNSCVKWIGGVWHAMSGNWDLDVTTFGEGRAEDLAAALDSGTLMPPEEVLLCSVAGDAGAAEVEDIIGELSSAAVVRMRAQAQACGIRNGYRKPDQLGADRWMAVIGAARSHGLPVVVADLGTATTLDAVDEAGRHVGGLILPGPRTMLNALSANTALEADFERAMGADRAVLTAGEAQTATEPAFEGGVITAQLGAVAQFVAWFAERLDENVAGDLRIVVTGGGAGAILHQSLGQSPGSPPGRSGYQLTHDPLLVFRGMLISRYGTGDGQNMDQGS